MSTELAFHLSPPDLAVDRCLNARHRQAGCTLCVDACPVQAIQLRPGAQPLPLLDSETCVGCGVCIPVCPTDAYSQALQPESKLVALRDELPIDEGLALICPQHSEPEQSSAPVRYAIRHQRCLAAFSPEQLLSLSNDGAREVWLDDRACCDCPIGAAHETLVAAVAAANQLLTAFNRPAALHLLSGRQAPPHEVRVLDGAAPAVSRRGFFRSLGKLAQQRVDEAAARASQPLFMPGVAVDQRLPYQTPGSLQHLNEHLIDLAAQTPPAPDFILDADTLPWASVHIDAEACSGCKLCARFCPTGALNYLWGEVDDGLVFNLTFQPALCLSCDICIAVCPENAVSITQQLPVDGLISPQRDLLMAGYLEPCERCGALTTRRPLDEQALCFVCRAPTMYHQRTQRAHLADLAQQLLKEMPDESPPAKDEK